MNLQQIKEKAKDSLLPVCKVCPECNGRACAGKVPGVGGVGTGKSFQNNYEDLARIRLNMTTIHDKMPQMQCNLFGYELAAPIIAAP
ncbi:MAG: alpha-hydroxy-acid oxidizing protein, partial [Bacillota bacterium]|nr:alpha-hydroxy-acid oxidizing protein [Bacillota bacterium]